eukprot:g21968.t1
MTAIPFAKPQEIGLDPSRLAAADALLRKWTTSAEPGADRPPIPGGMILVGRNGKVVEPKFFGKQGPEKNAEPIRRDGMFLLASISKPLTYLGAMILVERGLLNLSDKVTRYIPEFAANHKEDTLVQHLFTHTSGMPDMIPENAAFRRKHAPLKAFIKEAINAKPLFPPGTNLSYQSMGTLTVAEIIQRISGLAIRDFLKKEIFDPLGMRSTALGSRGVKRDRLVRVEIPEYQVGSNFGWNSKYWQEFGAPWGGVFSAPEDFARVCQLLLNGGTLGEVRLLSKGSVEAMTTNRLNDQPEIPEAIRRAQPWGLGFRLNHPGTPGSWGDLLGKTTFGHTGATGTMCWIDPERNGFCLLFTSAIRSRAPWRLVHLSNMDDQPVADEVETDDAQTAVAEPATAEVGGDDAPFRLSLTADIEDAGPCRKHVRITIPRSDLDHFYEAEVTDLVDKAAVPGFRVGHVPKALVQKRFKTELSDQVKQKVLVGSLEQVAEDYELDPINEPDIDIDSIDIPAEGDFQYEFDVEVRPEFDLPAYAGLKIKRPVREVSDEDVENQLNRFLRQYGQLETYTGAAEPGDFLSLSVEYKHDGKTLHKVSEFSAEIKPVLRCQDAEIEDFDKLMTGVKAGDKREVEITVSTEAEVLEMRGEKVTAAFVVKEVKRLEMPELTNDFLSRVGVEDEDDLRTEIRSMLHRQVTYEQRQAVRKQVLEKITASADWDLPETMVMKQTENALRREILEMQQAGFTTPEIRSRENEIRQRAVSTTTQALKEHFVLDKIATEENIDVSSAEVEMEMQLMAMQSGESMRRVKARLVKSGMDENLEAQIRERKAVDVILEKAEFEDVPMDPPAESTVCAVSHSVCGLKVESEPNVSDDDE